MRGGGKKDYDCELEVMMVVAQRPEFYGRRFTLREIADVCGVTTQINSFHERRALRKLNKWGMRQLKAELLEVGL